MPPLREHIDDLPGLVGSLIDKFNKKMGKTITDISPEALIKLQNYYFPGNIRELENIMERAFIFTDSPVITETNIELRKESLVKIPKAATIKNVEKKMIINALHRWEGNRTKAAEELGVSRKTVINKIKEYGISI